MNSPHWPAHAARFFFLFAICAKFGYLTFVTVFHPENAAAILASDDSKCRIDMMSLRKINLHHAQNKFDHASRQGQDASFIISDFSPRRLPASGRSRLVSGCQAASFLPQTGFTRDANWRLSANPIKHIMMI
jgi:hypothetical protein